MPEYKLIELRVGKIIRKKFGLPENMSDEVHFADLMMLATEKRDLDIDAGSNWLMLEGIIPASDFCCQPANPQNKQKSLFLRRFNELYKEKNG